MNDKINKLYEFAENCREKYDAVCAVCENSPEIYRAELREACECNRCGAYGANHTCPPFIGSAEECIAKAQGYSHIMIFQKVYPLEDSYDFYGMMEAKEQFQQLQLGIAEDAAAQLEGCFVLGAGGCSICEECTAKTGEPCRFPERAMSSLEAHCIQVSLLAELAGLKYINGQDTVTYFGAVFL